MAKAGKRIELGFLEDCDPPYLLSHYFPSKVGGKPSWLALEGLPRGERLHCKSCSEPCAFLLQVYSPIENKPECFHRAVFVFVCKNAECTKKNDASNFLVFRSQLGKLNKYYSDEPPSERYDASIDHPTAAHYQDLCLVCGNPGSKKCSRCHKATYCSKKHQTIDWKAGHKTMCDTFKDGKSKVTCATNAFLFPECELVTEVENYMEEDEEKTEEEKLREYDQFINETEGLSVQDDTTVDKDLNDMARKETAADKAFEIFRKRTAIEPEQILRHQLKGEPLWVSEEAVPTTSDIPKCTCGSERVFEFQILPHLLNHLKVDSLGRSIDWGTLAIYTCAENCRLDQKLYQEEFIWKQDFSSQSISA